MPMHYFFFIAFKGGIQMKPNENNITINIIQRSCNGVLESSIYRVENVRPKLCSKY